MNCPFCDTRGMEYASETELLVTSDSRLITDDSVVRYCRKCACFYRERMESSAQKIAAIYKEYTLYAPSGYGEARVAFDVYPGGIPKSRREVEFLSRFAELPQEGRILDYGCNHGLFLRAFLERYPHWQAVGADIEENYRQSFAAHMPQGASYCCLANEDPGTDFDIICCSHVLEHLPDPAASLHALASRLVQAEGTAIFIQAVNPLLNPFFHLIFEQNFHFTPAGLCNMLKRCGLHARCVNTDWIGKEISVLAASKDIGYPPAQMEATALQIEKNAEYVRDVAAALRHIAETGMPAGIFGASIMGTWLAGKLKGLAKCFIDENEELHGKTHLGLPVLPPARAPAGLPILCAMPEHMAGKIIGRLAHVCPGRLIAPPFSAIRSVYPR